MQGTVTELVGLAASIVVLAGITVAIVNGGNTARVISAIGSSFSGSIKAATGR